jgi:hypothetical protein
MKSKFENQQKIFEYRMTKASVEKEVYVILKPRHTWEKGLSSKKLAEEVEKRRKRKYSIKRIYEAISLLTRYGKRYGIYIKSDYGFVDTMDGKKREHRYFVPENKRDLSREEDKLDDRKDIVIQREESLKYFEEITIPHEQKLMAI